MSEVRLLIVAADPLARAGLATLLAELPGLVVAGRTAGGDELAAELDVYRPDVVVWDLGWEPEESLSQLGELAAELEAGRPPIVALLGDEEQAAAAWSAGARGLLLRNAD
ncbi:MAG: hypothetical protein ACRDHL_09185, partial [Candidatus Promineifilaceae bacterium]